MNEPSYTGYRRRLRTSWRVKLGERASRLLIGLGGAGTVVAVFGVLGFLLAVVLPLFGSGRADPETRSDVRAGGERGVEIVEHGIDEYRALAWALSERGDLRAFTLGDGSPVIDQRLAPDDAPSAWSFDRQQDSVAFGRRDGRLRLGRIEFRHQVVPPDDALDLAVGERRVSEGGVVERLDVGTVRRTEVRVTLEPELEARNRSGVVRLDHVRRGDSTTVLVLYADGSLDASRVHVTENLLTGELTAEQRATELPSPRHPSLDAPPDHLLLTRAGTTGFAIWNDGHTIRYDLRSFSEPTIAETVDLAPGDARLTAVTFLLGRATLLVGDDSGAASAWFVHEDPEATTPDGAVLELTSPLGKGAPVVDIQSSLRSRIAVVSRADGSIHVLHVSSGSDVLLVDAPADFGLRRARLAPKSDALVAFGAGGIASWKIDLGHPEASLGSLFRPVWYEGYPQPEHVWQSSGGDDADEPKFGLWPLVFGTIKATLYSVLFGVPVALFAAVFTSEFLAREWRARVKSVIELMASLPSVVLGFLAALVLAPFVQTTLPAVLTSFVAVPAALLVGAHLWQLLPNHLALRLSRLRLIAIVAAIPVGLGAALVLGPRIESVFFAGDIMGWLDGRVGEDFGGWFILLLPAASLATLAASALFLTPTLRRRTRDAGRTRTGVLDLARFALALCAALALAATAAWLFASLGASPRGPDALLDTYVQRNALIVGFVMGFAVIPIVYTIAEDALSAVPDSLRAASLGAGATPWQTAVRIVIPTAVSGLFSAVMIGLGRAVGETMIVLMAAGNTAITEWNVFNGFRTLSANIAVELPEAVRDSTHYRTLFLAALLLFLMTFAINTVAESVRIAFRKRTSQL